MGSNEIMMTNPGQDRLKSGNARKAVSVFGPLPTKRENVLNQDTFHAMLTLERRRAERSHRPFVLMLIDSHSLGKNWRSEIFFDQLTSILADATRETDIIGWYEDGATLAVIFTHISLAGESPITEVLHSKVLAALRDRLDHEVASTLAITFHVFPESWDKTRPERVSDLKLYPDLSRKTSRKRFSIVMKRAIDVVGSCLILLVLSPVLAAIAVLIKLTSKGPVIFEQERLGEFGKHFKCLKFRTMYANNDPKIHREYVQNFISGKAEQKEKKNSGPVIYKITNDPRVTWIGKFLRKTSLDEFPQFWNVVRGDMSLVGPRPPVAYEFEVYDYWHRRRVLEVKPGITGLWQVCGRSRTSFDDMVRLDLQYCQSWSLWLDLRILLATPRAVLMGDGAH